MAGVQLCPSRTYVPPTDSGPPHPAAVLVLAGPSQLTPTLASQPPSRTDCSGHVLGPWWQIPHAGLSAVCSERPSSCSNCYSHYSCFTHHPTPAWPNISYIRCHCRRDPCYELLSIQQSATASCGEQHCTAPAQEPQQSRSCGSGLSTS